MRGSGHRDGLNRSAVQRRLFGVFAASSLLLGPLVAEEISPAPEQPDWSAPPASAGSTPATFDDSVRADNLPGAGPEEIGSATAAAASQPSVSLASETTDAADDPNEIGVPNAGNSFLPSFDSSDGRPFFERQGLRFRAGPVHLRVQLSASAEYNDNIFGTFADPVSDIITTLVPKFLVGVGDFQTQTEDYFSLQYFPSYQYFLEHSDQSRVNQDLHLSGKATFSRYSTDVHLDYVDNNAPNATQSGRQSYELLTFLWNNIYYLGAKTFTSAGLTVTNQSYESGETYVTYSLSPQLNYAFSPKTTIFAGPYAGFVDVNQGSGTQTFQGASVGFLYDNLRKFTLQGSFGFQARQFEGEIFNGAKDLTTPIFDLTATWLPRENVNIELTFTRDIQVSDLLQGLTYTSTSIGSEATWRIFRNLTLGCSLGYQILEYQGDPISQTDGRTDNYLFASPTLSYSFWRDQMGIDIYYRRQQRTSDIETRGFTVNTYGIRFNYRF